MDAMNSLQNTILELQRQLVEASISYWKNYVFNTWQWWVNIGLLILPVILWWKLVDKKKLIHILFFGFLANGFAVLFDIIGETLVIWDYPYLIIPMDYILIDTDYAVLPVAYMLTYQYFLNWKGFIISNIIISGVFSFLAEPLLVWIGFYELHSWKYIYSFPIYIIIAIFCKWLTEVLIKMQSDAIDSQDKK